MAALEKTVSALVNRQLPDFVRADHPQFKKFVELYYKWLEDESKGNTVYHIMRSGEYRDIDNTLDPFIRLFKQELLPYFPERSELDLVKILKGAREFYVKKGSEESVKWLFRVLFGQDVEIYYPKQQILIASDGKWKLPQAFQLTLTNGNDTIDVNLLERHKATGSISKATCIIESANKTIDKTFGTEVLELYVSNVNKEFVNGEQLEIPYVDNNGVEQLFSEKIIGSISNIRVDSNIRTDPTQKRRGLTYNVGDPVVVFGGLADTADAADAIAQVGNVTVGSIEGLSVVFPGYGYRTYSNTEAIVYRSVGDDPNANLSTDIRVIGVSTIDSTNSQLKFGETISVDKMPIEYLASVLINSADYAVFTQNNRNIVITANNDGDVYYNNERVYANGNSYETANFKAQILTANTGWNGSPKTLILYNVSNTVPLTTAGFLVGVDTLKSTQSGSVFNVTTITSEQLAANADSQIRQALVFQELETGGVALFNIINGGYGFRSEPRIDVSSYFDTFWSENFAYGTANQKAYRQPMSAFGRIAHIYINNPGTGYANGDTITISGRGYDFAGYVNVNATGAITTTTITNRGEGYYGDKPATVTTSGGSGASLTAYGFGEGLVTRVETGAIGRVRDVRMISRGFDYIDTPLVSFKVVDMVIDGILEFESLSEGERVYQGATLETAVFQGIIKSYNRSTKLLRLFNYSGASFGNFNKSLEFTSEGGVKFFIDQAAKVPAPSAYPAEVRSVGLDNPWFYGNGQAKGIAEFFNGLIKYNGFYLNTDGFLSSDKKIQDGRVYHNYSYVIESEKNLADYQNTLKDIVHPIGMIMLSRKVSRANLVEKIESESIIRTMPQIKLGSQVYVTDSEDNVVTGIATEFANTYYAEVGDLFEIRDPTNPLRSQAKLIVAIDNNTSLNVESDFVYVGQGRITTNGGNNVVMITGNTNSIGQFITTDDVLRMNVNNTTVDRLVTGISGNYVTLNTTISTSNTNIPYFVVPDYFSINYDYRIIKVPD